LPKNIQKSQLKHIFHDNSFQILNGGVVDVPPVLEFLTAKVKKVFEKVEEIKYADEVWKVNSFQAKHLILATGAFPQNFLNEEFIKIRPVWGERLDIETDKKLTQIVHKKISVSQTVNGIVRVGATHFRNIFERESNKKEQIELCNDAKKIAEFNNCKIIKVYSGVRSASFDYFPIIGQIVNSKETIAKFPQLKHGRKYSEKEFIFYPNLTIFNGMGGYGFSLAPYLANLFVQNNLPKNVIPTRYFTRWVKKINN
jgi:tRNA 5-methylaminomethyl-2-thiouridine biosynthesis bifunctional protein